MLWPEAVGVIVAYRLFRCMHYLTYWCEIKVTLARDSALCKGCLGYITLLPFYLRFVFIRFPIFHNSDLGRDLIPIVFIDDRRIQPIEYQLGYPLVGAYLHG